MTIEVPKLWGVYTIDPDDGEAAWVSLPQIPGEPTLAFVNECEAEWFAGVTAKGTGAECHVGRLNSVAVK